MKNQALYIQESGNPKAKSILFLHGVGTTGWMWDKQVHALSDYHCIVPDLPGHGQSNAIAYTSTRRTAEMMASLIQQHANGGKAHIVGFSLGAMVALDLLAQAPEKVNHAILSGISVLPVPNMKMIRLVMPLLLLLMKTDFALKQNAKALNIPDEYFSQYKKGALATKRKAFANAMYDSSTMHVPENVKEILCRTLFVAGEHEIPIILQSIDILANAFPNGQSAVAPRVGHAWNIEKPDVFTAMIRTWIEDLPLPEDLQSETGRFPVL